METSRYLAEFTSVQAGLSSFKKERARAREKERASERWREGEREREREREEFKTNVTNLTVVKIISIPLKGPKAVIF